MMQNNFTTKAQEALQRAQNLAAEHNHQELTPLHVLLTLIKQPEGIVGSMLQKLEVPIPALEDRIGQGLQFLPHIMDNAAAGQMFISKEMVQIFNQSEREAKNIGDEY